MTLQLKANYFLLTFELISELSSIISNSKKNVENQVYFANL